MGQKFRPTRRGIWIAERVNAALDQVLGKLLIALIATLLGACVYVWHVSIWHIFHPTPEVVVSASRRPIDSAASEVRRTLTHHFDTIQSGNYGTAWEDLVGAAAGGGEAAWIAESREDHLRAFNLQVATKMIGTREAAATIVHFKTYEEGACKLWSGSWSLIEAHGRWLISDAKLTPRPCN